MPLVKNILSQTAALLNDSAQTMFTNDFLLPHFKTSYAEMRELFQANNVPVINQEVEGITINIGVTDIGGPTGPALPQDLIEVQQVLERQNGITQSFIQMTRVEFLPEVPTASSALVYYAWQRQQIRFPSVGATSIREIKLQYIASSIPEIISPDTLVTVINSETFLAYRTAALASQFRGENSSRAESLNFNAQLAIDRLLTISVKARQGIFVRRRPFRAGFKARGGWW